MRQVTFAAVMILGLGPAAMRADDPKFEPEKEKLALTSARTLENATKQYHLKFGAAPEKLADLVKPPFGMPFIEGGEKALLDPWGKPYRYVATPDERGVVRSYVWTERGVGGKAKVIGNKPPVKKQ